MDSAVNQGLHNGFNKINYGEVALSTTIGAVSSATGPSLSKSNSKHIIKQTSIRKSKVASNPSSYVTRINASKYYRSQTSTIKNNYYKKTAKKGFISTVANAIVSWFKDREECIF